MNRRCIFLGVTGILLSLSIAGIASAQDAFNRRGNILISDQFNNRVIEVNPATNHVVWEFGNGSSVAGPQSVVAPNDAQRIGSLTLIAGTGAPQGRKRPAPTHRALTTVCSWLMPRGKSFGNTGKSVYRERDPTN